MNKVSTKAVLRWDVVNSKDLPDDVRERFIAKFRRRISQDGHLVLTSQRFRDRGRNVADCTTKLQEMLSSVAEAPRSRKSTRPTKASKVRQRRNKEAKSRKKQLRRGPSIDD